MLKKNTNIRCVNLYFSLILFVKEISSFVLVVVHLNYAEVRIFWIHLVYSLIVFIFVSQVYVLFTIL